MYLIINVLARSICLVVDPPLNVQTGAAVTLARSGRAGGSRGYPAGRSRAVELGVQGGDGQLEQVPSTNQSRA
jgi:hypothetical protein